MWKYKKNIISATMRNAPKTSSQIRGYVCSNILMYTCMASVESLIARTNNYQGKFN